MTAWLSLLSQECPMSVHMLRLWRSWSMNTKWTFFTKKVMKNSNLPFTQVVWQTPTWSWNWWPRCESICATPWRLSMNVELNSVGDHRWLTSPCAHHRPPGGFWVSVPRRVWGQLSDPSVLQPLVCFASWRWRWSWRCCCWQRKSARVGVAAGAFSPWQEKPGSWGSCRGAASPSCSHWADLLQNYYLRDAAGGNSSLQPCGETSSARARLNSAVTSPGGCLCVHVGTSLKSRQAGFTL